MHTNISLSHRQRMLNHLESTMFQSHDQREAFKAIADRVARDLHADLQAKTIASINIDVIRSRLVNEVGWRNRAEFEALEEMTTRRVVERAA